MRSFVLLGTLGCSRTRFSAGFCSRDQRVATGWRLLLAPNVGIGGRDLFQKNVKQGTVWHERGLIENHAKKQDGGCA